MKSKPLWFSCWNPTNHNVVETHPYDFDLYNKYFKSDGFAENFWNYSAKFESLQVITEVMKGGLLKSDDVH